MPLRKDDIELEKRMAKVLNVPVECVQSRNGFVYLILYKFITIKYFGNGPLRIYYSVIFEREQGMCKNKIEKYLKEKGYAIDDDSIGTLPAVRNVVTLEETKLFIQDLKRCPEIIKYVLKGNYNE